MFLIDNTINDETSEKLKLYCEAFFSGVTVVLQKPGSLIHYKDNRGKNETKLVPSDFIGANEISTRLNGDIP